LRPILFLCCLLLTGLFFTSRVNCQMAFSESFAAGAHWTYDGYWKSEISGISGECVGSYTYTEVVKGRATVKALNESTLTIENHKDVDDSTQNGCYCHTAPARSGIFRPNRHYIENETATIDRRTLTYRSFVANSEYRSSLVGRPAEYFLPTPTEGGPYALYSFMDQEIVCHVSSRNITSQGVNFSVVTLRYYGPTNLSLPLNEEGKDFDRRGVAEYAFNFEPNSGLLISYSIEETMVIISDAFGMSRCTITSTNTGNYSVKSTSWNISKTPSTAPSPKTTATSIWMPTTNQTITTPISPSFTNTTLQAKDRLTYLAALSGAVALATIGYIAIRRRIGRRR
jgi:hypothetical protein